MQYWTKLIGYSVFLVLVVTGCATIGTKDLPVSDVTQVKVDIPEGISDRTVAVYLAYEDARIKGGHHEGLMQVRQPWIFGMSKHQKEILYGEAHEFARNAFISELLRQGVLVTPFEEKDQSRLSDYDILVSGSIEKIILNTYGRGTVEGFGSAGDYWEAKILLEDVTVTDQRSDEILYQGEIETYAKLRPCPVQLKWNFMTMINKSLSSSTRLPEVGSANTAVQSLSKGTSFAKTWDAAYFIDGYKTTPIEVAARQAACELLMRSK